MKKWLLYMSAMVLSLGLMTAFGSQTALADPVPDEVYSSTIYNEDCDHSWEQSNSYYDEEGEFTVYTCQNCYSSYTIMAEHEFETVISPADTSSYTEGSSVKECKNCDYSETVETWKPASQISLSTTTFRYTGKSKTPTVTVTDTYGNTVSKYAADGSRNYSVKYSNNLYPGEATVTVTMTGRYEGSFTTNFLILPAKAVMTSAKYIGNASMTVKWKAQKKVSGYAIQYSTSKSFSDGYTCTVTASSSKTSITIKKLAKTKYYVRVFAYKTVGDYMYRGYYSDKKAVNVKTGTSMKSMINAIKSTTKYYKTIKSLTNNKVDIRKYSTTYSRLKAIYHWHALNATKKFGSCLACNYNFARCVYYLTYGSKTYDNWIRIAADTYKNNSGSEVMHKWCVLMLQGKKYIFDPRMQGYLGKNGYSNFGCTYGSSAGKHYHFDYWYI